MSAEIRRNWFFKDYWDFGGVPPAPADEFFGKAIMICANGDGELAQAEKDWIVGYFATVGAPDDVLQRLIDYDAEGDLEAMVEPFPDPGIHNAIIYFALKACYADGEITEGEMAAILKLANRLNISKEVVDSLQAIYKDELAFRAKRNQVLFPAGTPF